MTAEDQPQPIRLGRDVLAALLFDGTTVYPGSPFAFLEAVEPAGPSTVDEALRGLDRADLDRSLGVLRRPDRAVITLTWGPPGPQRRTIFVGRADTFVLAFTAPSNECITSLPIARERLTDFLMRDVGWAEDPVVGEVAMDELHPERLDIFSVEVNDDTFPPDLRQMTRAAFAGEPGQRVMVLPGDQGPVVGFVALDERDLRTAISLLLGSPPPLPSPAPDLMIEATVQTPAAIDSHTIYAFDTRAVEHRVSAGEYSVDRYARHELRDRVLAITHLRSAGPPRLSRSFRISEDVLNDENPDGLPKALIEILRQRRASVIAVTTRQDADGISGEELAWVDAGSAGLWRVEPTDDRGEVSIEPATAASIADALLPS